MIISARSPDCIHDDRLRDGSRGRPHAASNCSTCPTDNVKYQQWGAFWDALPYVWQWDALKPGPVLYGGHWEVRESGEPVDAEVVLAHLRGMGVTVVGLR